MLNEYVLGFDLQIKSGYCGFRKQEVFDAEFNVFKSVFAHNCKNYSNKITVYIP